MDSTPQIDAEKLLASVAEEHSFRLKNGGAINSLRQLYSALQGMEDSVFSHHVSGERHDFGNWVKDIHKDYRLANSLFSAGTRDDCAKAVGSRVYELEKMVEGQKQSMVLAPQAHSGEPRQTADEASFPILGIMPPSEEDSASGKEGGFNREVEIAKAILERKPITHLLEPRKRRQSPKPQLPAVKVEKSELETAAERLEKILSDAAKAKIEDDRKHKLVTGCSKVVPEEKSAADETSAAKLLAEAGEEPLFSVGPVEDGKTDDLIRLIEQKSFASQLKSDLRSIFSKSSVKGFADDIRIMAPSIKRTPKAAPEPAAAPGSDKDRIIAHLKKVYK